MKKRQENKRQQRKQPINLTRATFLLSEPPPSPSDAEMSILSFNCQTVLLQKRHGAKSNSTTSLYPRRSGNICNSSPRRSWRTSHLFMHSSICRFDSAVAGAEQVPCRVETPGLCIWRVTIYPVAVHLTRVICQRCEDQWITRLVT